MVRARLTTLETALGYQFKDLTLLDQALTHRSHSARHNERLEFLGDSVLNFVVAALLYTRFTTVNEGDLSRSRASLVKQAALADIAQSLKLSDYLRMGEGELKSGGFRRPSILSDALEAVFAAVLLDGGYQAAHDVIARQYETIFRNVDPATLGKDPKTLLQEVLQARKMDLPVYTVIGTFGAAHDQSFEVQCEVPKLDIRLAAHANSRRAAEQLAAAQVIAAIESIAPAKGARTSRVRKAVQMALPDTPTQENK